jgi:peptidoglycan/xylan/chitin deacetylase (PgdA/CDA1 family)
VSRYPRSNWQWPDGAPLMISINLAFEGFLRRSQYGSRAGSNHPDPYSLSFGEYGAKAGMWRLMDLLDEFGFKGSCSTSGLAAEQHPEVVRALADEGHEIVGHGWANDELASEDDPFAEQAMIRRCTEALATAARQRPVGWTSPGSCGSSHTLGYLRAEGYEWNGDDASDDLPFVRETPHGPIVIMPRTNIPHNDLAQWLRPANAADSLWVNWQNTIDTLYAEGLAGSPKWTEITLHAHIAGRPTLIPIVRKCLAYAREKSGTRVALKREIAAWARSLLH